MEKVPQRGHSGLITPEVTNTKRNQRWHFDGIKAANKTTISGRVREDGEAGRGLTYNRSTSALMLLFRLGSFPETSKSQDR